MRLVRLKFLLHYGPLLKKFSESCHNLGVQHIDLKIKPISDIEAIERNTFHQGDSGDISVFACVSILSITHGQGVVDGKMQSAYVCINYANKLKQRTFRSCANLPSSGVRLPPYSMKRYGNAP